MVRLVLVDYTKVDIPVSGKDTQQHWSLVKKLL